jgi:hypothetical protein
MTRNNYSFLLLDDRLIEASETFEERPESASDAER